MQKILFPFWFWALDFSHPATIQANVWGRYPGPHSAAATGGGGGPTNIFHILKLNDTKPPQESTEAYQGTFPSSQLFRLLIPPHFSMEGQMLCTLYRRNYNQHLVSSGCTKVASFCIVRKWQLSWNNPQCLCRSFYWWACRGRGERQTARWIGLWDRNVNNQRLNWNKCVTCLKILFGSFVLSH